MAHTAPAKPWYNIFGGRYSGDQPFFYERDSLPWVKTLEDNWQVMRDELVALSESQPERLRPYFINKSMSFPPRHWKTMGLYFWRYTMHANCRRCPETMRILKSIPGLTSCSLSVLEPGSNINPHQGDTDAIYRCHVGLSVPAGLPDCGFQVGTEIRGWENGKALPFCDAQTHTAWNQTDERRLIMIVDVVRPEFLRQQNAVCAHVLASSVIQMLYQASPTLNRLPGFVKRALYGTFQAAIVLYLPIQRRFR
ncbi:MAG: aspartyl/asparaginyl beta-hydroxylase domain-containing protein [Pseudomonadota bacterium]